jgi:hypothetical protein
VKNEFDEAQFIEQSLALKRDFLIDQDGSRGLKKMIQI